MLPILSIIMPTHNRSQYAISAINSILSFSENSIELVVTDTSEDSDLKDLVNLILDDRLKYRYINEPLSMTENYNFAMSMATGTYVCLIGDDDTITEDAIFVASWAKENGVEIVSPLVVANYAWPDFKHRFLGNAHAGRLYIKRSYGTSKWRNSKIDLENALRRGALGTEGLPKVYHSIVARSLMEKIKEQSGAYFHGVSPDVSGAIGLAIVSEKYLEIDYPLTIPGASGKSNSGRSAMNKHKGTLKGDSHTKRFKKLNWPTLIPHFTSVETVWAQAAYETIHSLRPELIDKYNFIWLYAVCAIKHGDHMQEIREAIAEFKLKYKIGILRFWITFTKFLIMEILDLFVKYGRRILIPTAAGGKNYVGNLKNIYEAQDKLKAIQQKSKIDIYSILMNLAKVH